MIFCKKAIEAAGIKLDVRACEGVVYVREPQSRAHQSLNIYAPEAFFVAGA